MYYKIVFNSLPIIFLAVIQSSFISALPGWLSHLNLILVVLIFVVGRGDVKLAFWWAIGAGALLGIFNFVFFGIHMVSFFMMVLIANFLLTNFLADRSLYSFLALIVAMTIFYELVLHLSEYTVQLFNKSLTLTQGAELEMDSWRVLGKQLILNTAAGIFIFYLLNIISDTFKPVLFIRKKY